MRKIRCDVVIIGSGIGGLCTGALLAKAGYRLVIVERQPILGGRYTSVKFKGYTIPTASWMLLYGTDDPVYKTLEDIGAPKIEMRGAGTPMARYRINGNIYDWPEKGGLKHLLSVATDNRDEAERVMSAIREAMTGEVHDSISFRDWLLQYTSNSAIHGIFGAQIATWCGMNTDELPAREFVHALLSFRGKSDFRIPRNGLRDIIELLTQSIQDREGLILYPVTVKQIVVKNGTASGVLADDGSEAFSIEASVVISNAGPKRTIALAGAENFDEGYLKEVSEKIRPAVGMDYLFTTDQPLLDFSGTLYTTDTRRKEGWSVPTLMWPEHAPEGKHLLHGFAVPGSTVSYDPREEERLIMQDLMDIFPEFDECGGELLLRRNFRGEWPCTRAWQGFDIGQRTPVKNLYNVGDGVKPKGWIVGSGAAESGRIVAREIMGYT